MGQIKAHKNRDVLFASSQSVNFFKAHQTTHTSPCVEPSRTCVLQYALTAAH